MVHHHLGLGLAGVELLKDIFQRRHEVLDGGLSVEATRQDMEEVWVAVVQVSEPVLVKYSLIKQHHLMVEYLFCEGEVVLIFHCQHGNHVWLEVGIVQRRPSHVSEVVEDHSCVESLFVSWVTKPGVRIGVPVGGQHDVVVGGEVQAQSNELAILNMFELVMNELHAVGKLQVRGVQHDEIVE